MKRIFVFGLLVSTVLGLDVRLANAQCTYNGQNVNTGSAMTVNNRETACNTFINGGEQTVESGGKATSTKVNADGSQIVKSGGEANTTTIDNGTQEVSGVANNTFLYEGNQLIKSGGIANFTTVDGLGQQVISLLGTANNTTLKNGAKQIISGEAYDTNIEATATQEINEGGKAVRTTLKNGAVQNVNALGTADYTEVLDGGVQNIAVDGVATNSTIYGTQNVEGTANDAIIEGGVQDVKAAGFAYKTIINSGSQIVAGYSDGVKVYGGVQTVTGLTENTLVSGGTQIVETNGVALSTVVENGKVNVIGTVENATARDKGVINVYNGSKLGGITTVKDGGVINVNTNGRDTIVDNTAGGSDISINNGVLKISGGVGSVTFKPTMMGNGIIELSSKNSLHFTELSGQYTLYVNDIANAGTFSNMVLYDASASGASFVLDERSSDYGLYKALLIDLGGNGINVVKSSEPIEAVKNVASVASVTTSTVNMLSNSMHKRIGEIQWQKNNYSSPIFHKKWGVWARGIGVDATISEKNSADLSLYGLEFGADYQLMSSVDRGQIYIGVLGQYVTGTADYKQQVGRTGEGDVDAYGFGAYITWLGNRGWFADAVVRQQLVEQDVTSYSNMLPFKYNTKQSATTVSMEIGRQIMIIGDYAREKNNKTTWFFTPKAQFNIAYIGSDDFTTNNGHAGSIDKTSSYQGSLGFITGPRFSLYSGARIEPYVKAVYIHEFDGETDADIGGVKQKAEAMNGSRYEVGGGISVRLNSTFSAHLDVSYQDASDFEALAANLGMRVEF